MESGLTDRVYGDLYAELFSAESEKSVLREPDHPEPKEILEAIHDAGGIAVLAHPALYGNMELLDELIREGLDGIEVWHPSANAETVERLRKLAKKNGLLMTGGSDFHGMYGVGGVSVGTCVTPDENLDALLSYKARRRRKLARAAKAAEKEAAETE
jgi:hypothetical protein